MYEVTFDEYDVFVLATGARRPGDEGWGRGRRPVINVSWEDARAYVEWLSNTTDKEFRLLSEAEWEYAARAGTTTGFWWSDDDPTLEHANFKGNVGKTTEVGEYPGNPWGLHDMNGNVGEWVEDCWHENYDGKGRPDDARAWTGGVCNRRVLRGGSWGILPELLRSANRDNNHTVSRSYTIGFRVARTLSRTESVTP